MQDTVGPSGLHETAASSLGQVGPDNAVQNGVDVEISADLLAFRFLLYGVGEGLTMLGEQRPD